MKELLTRVEELFRCGKPVAFWPYTSCVLYSDDNVEFTRDDRDTEALYMMLMQACVAVFRLAGIKSQRYAHRVEGDNKVVFQWDYYGKTLFLGFYDGRISLGTKMRSDHQPKNREA
jgi:hypothetical protein